MASSSTDRKPAAPTQRQDLRQNRAPNEQTSNLFSQPSSSTNGFFQSPPKVLNQFYDDVALQRALGLFLSSSVRNSIITELASFGDKVLSKEVLHFVADAEKNPPYLRTWDTWGKRRDELVTSEGWRNLQDLGIKEGMVSIGYENKNSEYSRVHHFAKYHLWCGSSAWVNCPSLMTDGAASLLRTHLSNPGLPSLQRPVLRSAFERLTSRDPVLAWTTGQWMTERAGGSDVSQTETLATYSPDSSSGPKALSADGSPLGPWLINGFKWFSSATDSSMMVLLARTPKGISAFYAPMRRTLPMGPDSMGYATELNGIQIQRLKQKLGTRALPTAELELKGVRGYLIGDEGRGTKQIATVLNIARIHNAVSAVGFWGRGLGISRAFARCRKVGQKPLHGKASHVRTLAKMHAEYRANMLFTFFVSALLGVAEQSQHAAYQGSETKPIEPSQAIPDPSMAEHLLRLLTPAVKGVTAKKAISGLAECMESLGGVGYLENEDMQFNIARLYRDANVLSIWEGTTDMMAHDVLRVVYGKTSKEVMAAMDAWVWGLLGNENATTEQGGIVGRWWMEFRATMEKSEKEEMEMRSREMMERLADIVMGVLLVVDARRDGDEVAAEMAEMWIVEKEGRGVSAAGSGRWQDSAARDRRIVFGTGDLGGARAKL
jgi:alkylation response protein AidB-like acyl-CoA dehydrogenase